MGGALGGRHIAFAQSRDKGSARSALLLGEFAQEGLVALAVAAGPPQAGVNVDTGNDEPGVAFLALPGARGAELGSAMAIARPDPAQQNAEELVGVDRLGNMVAHACLEAKNAVRFHRIGGHGDDRKLFVAGFGTDGWRGLVSS